ALEVATEGRQVQISLEDLALGVAHLEPHRAGDLPELARHRTAVDPVESPRQLHRQGRPTLAALAERAARRTASQRDRVDAGVPEEPAILVEHEGFPGGRRDLIERRAQ